MAISFHLSAFADEAGNGILEQIDALKAEIEAKDARIAELEAEEKAENEKNNKVQFDDKTSDEVIKEFESSLDTLSLDNKDEVEKEKSLKLIGYSNLDKDILKEFDSNYMDSSVIEGIKTNNDGSFSSNSMKKMLTDNQIDKVISITEDKINETIDNVLNSNFDINPKYDNANIGCEFCKYKDLCFMKEYDLKKIEASDVFGGESDE